MSGFYDLVPSELSCLFFCFLKKIFLIDKQVSSKEKYQKPSQEILKMRETNQNGPY